MMHDLLIYVMTGFLVAVLIPWACLETAAFLAGLKPKQHPIRHTHWILVLVLLMATSSLTGCAGGSKDDGTAIVSPKAPGGAGATRTEGDDVLPSSPTPGSSAGTVTGSDEGGATSGEGSGGDGGETTAGASLGEPPLDTNLSPALIMHVVKTILN